MEKFAVGGHKVLRGCSYTCEENRRRKITETTNHRRVEDHRSYEGLNSFFVALLGALNRQFPPHHI